MKLKHFVGKDVRGYMNFDIHFRDGVTFLIGINGSGKTTVLKLLSGLLEPSYRVLNDIEFSELILKCETDEGKNIYIFCQKDNTCMILQYDDKNEESPIKEEFKISERFQSMEENTDFEREEYVKNRGLFENSIVVEKIKSIQTPLFLGINRRIIEMNRGIPALSMRGIQMRRRSRTIDDAVDRALLDIQNMVFDSVRHNAKKQGTYADNFRKKVLHDSFKFYNEIPSLLTDDYDKELLLLPQKKENIKVAVK